MASLWKMILDAFGMSPSRPEKLDLAAQQMSKELDLHRTIAGKSVAAARAKHRELTEAINEFETLKAAAIQLNQEGRTDVVQKIAVDMNALNTRIASLTEELNVLNAAATESVDTFNEENEENVKLLREHGQLKAASQMNDALEQMQKEMKAISGQSSAKGAYKAIASDIKVKTQELRAIAELENSDSAGKAAVRKALSQVGAQKMLELINSQSSTSALPNPSQPMLAVDNARAALQQDPIKGFLSLPTLTKSLPSVTQTKKEEEGESDIIDAEIKTEGES